MNGTTKNVSDSLLSQCVSVLGDLLNVFSSNHIHVPLCPSELTSFVRDKDIQAMVERGLQSQNQHTREAAIWTKKEASSYL